MTGSLVSLLRLAGHAIHVKSLRFRHEVSVGVVLADFGTVDFAGCPPPIGRLNHSDRLEPQSVELATDGSERFGDIEARGPFFQTPKHRGPGAERIQLP